MTSTTRSKHALPSRAPTRMRTPWLLASAGAALLALTLTLRQEAVARQTVDLGLPPPLMLAALLLLLALGFGILAWPARRRAGVGVRRPLASPDWSRLTQMANWFFDAHGLVREGATRTWAAGQALLLHNESHRFLVQTKLWRARRVDAAAVQRLSREMARRGADRGMLLCAGDVFTAAARQLARRSGILLLEPQQLSSRPSAAPRPDARSQAATLSTLPPPAEPAPVRAEAPTVLLSLDDAAPPRFEFMPTVPMSKAERLAAVAPVLRPDHEVARGLCEFMPTVPSALSPSAATQA